MAYDLRTRPGQFATGLARSRMARSTLAISVVAGLTFLSAVTLITGPTALEAGLILIGIVLFGSLAHNQLERALPWLKGGRSEEAVGLELEQLRPPFRVLHDFAAIGGGNIDHLVCGPTGAFLIETKHRRYEDGQLGKAKRQALWLHGHPGVWVTPVICLDRRDHRPRKHAGVWIMSRTYVVAWIQSQKNAAPSLESLARFADQL